MTIAELIELLEEYPDGYDVMLEIDGIIDECINIYSDIEGEIIIGETQ